MKCTNLAVLACAALSVFTVGHTAYCQAPDISTYKNLSDYITALNKSTDPQAAVIRSEIANGPTDLAMQIDACKKRNIVPGNAAHNNMGAPLVVPDDKNAYPIYKKWDAARRAQTNPLPGYADPLTLNFSYTADQLAQVQQSINANSDVYSLLNQAAVKPYLVAPQGDNSYEAMEREAARELKTESYLLAAKKSYSEAISLQAQGFNIASQASQNHDLIGFLVGSAIESVTLQGLQEIMSMAGPNQAVDEQVDEVIDKASPVVSLKEAFKSEIPELFSNFEPLRTAGSANFLYMFGPTSNSPAQQPGQAASASPEVSLFTSNLCDAVEARYLSHSIVLFDAADAKPSFRRSVFGGIESLPLANNDPVDSMTSSLSPQYSKIAKKMDQATAKEQVTLAAAYILDSKAKTGAFPPSLPVSFIDPFNDKPLGYTKTGDTGFVVFSVGQTGAYNGVADDNKEAYYRYPAPQPQPIPAMLLGK